MTLFVLNCIDRKDALDRRLATRPAHLAYVEAQREIVKLGGPLLNDNGQPIGSLLIVETDDKAGAEAFAAADPYRQAGVFETVEICAFRVTVGALS